MAVVGWLLLMASCSTDANNNNMPTGGNTSVAGSPASTGGTGGSGTNACAVGLSTCYGACVNPQTDLDNCGTCGTRCAEGLTCASGQCACSGGLTACTNGCANVQSDGMNCGACGTACTGTLVCSQGKCGETCGAGEEACGNSCVVKASDAANCGFCGNKCLGGQACVNGSCGCDAGKSTCSGVCVSLSSDPANCGTCGTVCAGGQACTNGTCGGGTGGSGAGGSGGAGTGGTGAGGAPPGRNGCALKPGLISDFEEGGATGVVIAHEDRTGTWEMFNDATSTSQTVTLEPSGGTADCDKVALHVKGTGYSSWGAGVGFALAGTKLAPTPYNATTKQFTGIRFKAKLGTTADSKSPVRFNISTPWTESKENSGGQCAPTALTTTKAGTECYQHAGRYLPPGSGEGELAQTWKTFNFCFDRDLYPLSLPSNLTTEQRNNIGSNILKVQFQFNQGKDYSGAYKTEWPGFAKSLPFDLWLDDVEFFTGECPNKVVSPSNGAPAKAFPQNANIGTCAPATNASKFAAAIAQAYARWTKTFVQSGKIVAPEQQGAITSEALGYGMMIAAAMGDKTAFDSFHKYVKDNGGSGTGLMTWKNGDTGSASDGDIDIAYALYMANAQWGGYDGAASDMAKAIMANDIVNGVVRGGSAFQNAPFNPSYFAPAAFRKFGSTFAAAITENYRLVTANVTNTTSGVPTDWADPSTGKASAGTGQVTSEITDGNNGAMGYDSARVPWRLGLDACLGGGNTTALKAIVDFFAAKYDAGASIDLMKAGWYKTTGQPHPMSKDLQGSYIGPMGAGAMAMNNAAMRDRAFRAILDILESGDFNHTYFPSTVGMLTVLMMSGNFPTP